MTLRHTVTPEDRTLQLLFTPEEAARALRIGRTRLYHLLSTGHLASIKIGGSRRITADALHAYVASLTGNGAQDWNGANDRPAQPPKADTVAFPSKTAGKPRLSKTQRRRDAAPIEAPRLPFPPSPPRGDSRSEAQ